MFGMSTCASVILRPCTLNELQFFCISNKLLLLCCYSKAISTPKVSSRAAVERPPPQTLVESDSDHDGGYEQDYSYDGYDNTVQTQEEVVVDVRCKS